MVRRKKETQAPVEVHTVKDAKRLLSRLITQLQEGEIENRTAKDLAYLLQIYVNTIREHELEERLTAIEHKLQGEAYNEAA